MDNVQKFNNCTKHNTCLRHQNTVLLHTYLQAETALDIHAVYIFHIFKVE
jgi:hypothetical protein